MDFIKELWAWLMLNYSGVVTSLVMLVAALEAIVALTPTKKDDGFVKRMGEWIDKLRRLLKVPSIKREEGSLKPVGVHKKNE